MTLFPQPQDLVLVRHRGYERTYRCLGQDPQGRFVLWPLALEVCRSNDPAIRDRCRPLRLRRATIEQLQERRQLEPLRPSWPVTCWAGLMSAA